MKYSEFGLRLNNWRRKGPRISGGDVAAASGGVTCSYYLIGLVVLVVVCLPPRFAASYHSLQTRMCRYFPCAGFKRWCRPDVRHAWNRTPCGTRKAFVDYFRGQIVLYYIILYIYFRVFARALARMFARGQVRLMRKRKKEQKAEEVARKLRIKEAKAEAERQALEEEAALTEGMDDLEKVLMRSKIRAKVCRREREGREERCILPRQGGH